MKNVGGESGRGGGGQTTGWWLAETDRQMGRLTSRDMDLYTGKRLSKSQENNNVLQQMITDDNNVLYLDNTFQNRVTNSHQQRNNLLYNTVDAVREIHTSSPLRVNYIILQSNAVYAFNLQKWLLNQWTQWYCKWRGKQPFCFKVKLNNPICPN